MVTLPTFFYIHQNIILGWLTSEVEVSHAVKPDWVSLSVLSEEPSRGELGEYLRRLPVSQHSVQTKAFTKLYMLYK